MEKAAEVLRVPAKWEYRGNLYVLVVEHCPFCSGRHEHGAGVVKPHKEGEPSVMGPEEAYYGRRASHCDTGGGFYVLTR